MPDNMPNQLHVGPTAVTARHPKICNTAKAKSRFCGVAANKLFFFFDLTLLQQLLVVDRNAAKQNYWFVVQIRFRLQTLIRRARIKKARSALLSNRKNEA